MSDGKKIAYSFYPAREFDNTCILLSLEKILEFADIFNISQLMN